jgi:rRNA-processing protein CGR1
MVNRIVCFTRIIAELFIGKQWHEPKAAFRPKAGNSTYEKRQEERKAMAATKAKEKEMKDEKEADRQVGRL